MGQQLVCFRSVARNNLHVDRKCSNHTTHHMYLGSAHRMAHVHVIAISR